MKNLFSILLIVLGFTPLQGQSVNIQGYTYAANNSGYIGQVEISLAENGNESPDFFPTDSSGKFVLQLPAGHDFELIARKNGFKEVRVPVSTKDKTEGEFVFLKFPMERSPGYILEGTLSEIFVNNAPPGVVADKSQEVNAIDGATIELYNNTTHEEVFRLVNNPLHTFNCRLEQGNEYTMLVRKKGFYNKRSKIYVNIKGCILCFEGVGTVTPGVVDNLTRENTMGVLGANITLRRIKIGEGVKLDNIYYDLGKWDIRPDAKVPLDNLVRILKENPSIVIELQSHTDSRNSFDYNMDLSQKRAQSAVDYIVGRGIGEERVKAKGYGESLLKNKCKDDVPCTEVEHQENRRTEFAVIQFQSDPYEGRSLRSIMADEETEEIVASLSSSYYEAPLLPEGGMSDSTNIPVDSAQHSALSILDYQSDIVYSKKEDTLVANNIPAQHIPPPPTKDSIIIENTFNAFTESDSVRKNNSPSIDSSLFTLNSSLIDSSLIPHPSSLQDSSLIPHPSSLQDSSLIPHPSSLIRQPIEFEVVTGQFEAPTEYFVAEVPPPVLRKARAIPAGYSGFMVELISGPRELPTNDSFFNEYGKIFLDKDLEGNFCYSVGEFPRKVQAEAFVKQILAGRFPGAKIVEYQNGNRK